MSIRSLIAVALPALVAGCQPGMDLTTTTQAITNGTQSNYPGVVGIVLPDDHIACSGVVIAPRVVVTAAHCVTTPGLRVYAGPGVEMGGGQFFEVAVTRPHPDYRLATMTAPSDNDIALLLLATPAVVETRPRLTRPFDDTFVGKPLRVVGYGHMTIDGEDPHLQREGLTVLESYGARDFRFGPNPSQTCVGDSGGPAFITLDGVEYFAGISASGDSECKVYARNLRIDVYESFIQSFLAATVDGGARVGDRCWTDATCAEGTCMFPSDAPTVGYCTQPCGSEADCAGGMVCNGRCEYPLPSPGAIGTSCVYADECHGATCGYRENHVFGTCALPCTGATADTCDDGFACEKSTKGSMRALCFEEPGGCGCRTGHTSPWSLALALGVLAGATRRRRRN